MKKVQENPKQMNKLRSFFYPKNYEGSEDKAFDACKAEAGKEEVYWDEEFGGFYYYPIYQVGK